MNALPLITVAALAVAAPAHAEPPPGLVEARLLPGWVTAAGTRMTALDLRLEPGWKTYWRVPGDAGIPPRFDWQGAVEATYLWPAPEVIDSGGTRSFGYHDALLLPIELSGDGARGPLTVALSFGLCESICVPAGMTLTAPAAGDRPDPAIEAALAAAPARATAQPDCAISEIEDGMRVAASLPHPGSALPDAAMELDARAQEGGQQAGEAEAGEVWVSAPAVALQDGRLTATADFVPPSGGPFPLDPAMLRLTLLDGSGAIEFSGCRPG